jgi:hypothetical protein
MITYLQPRIDTTLQKGPMVRIGIKILRKRKKEKNSPKTAALGSGGCPFSGSWRRKDEVRPWVDIFLSADRFDSISSKHRFNTENIRLVGPSFGLFLNHLVTISSYVLS